jgi:hypothetical protein
MTFTQVHVAISLVGILSGIVVLFGLLRRKSFNRLTELFLASTLATSITGFLFPFNGVTPGIILGMISVILLIVASFARYARLLEGAWRWIYVIAAMMALYFNVFVLIAQLFQKVNRLKALAPTQSEPPFAITQLSVLVLFIVLTIAAVSRFRPSSPRSA